MTLDIYDNARAQDTLDNTNEVFSNMADGIRGSAGRLGRMARQVSLGLSFSSFLLGRTRLRGHGGVCGHEGYARREHGVEGVDIVAWQPSSASNDTSAGGFARTMPRSRFPLASQA